MSSVVSSIVSPKFPTLYLYVDSDDESLKSWYRERINVHNTQVDSDSCPNSGFDLATPNDIIAVGNNIHSITLDTLLKTKMVCSSSGRCMGFYTYPRSSISKTPLMLANHVGVIDSGYRGHLLGKFRNLGKEDFTLSKMERYLQICAPNLQPFYVCMVDNQEDLGKTSRGEGGFGSTGK